MRGSGINRTFPYFIARNRRLGTLINTKNKYEAIIKGGVVVLRDGAYKLDIGLAGGKIAAIAEAIAEKSDEIIDAEGRIILPGMIDTHVHLDEPGMTHWEGFRTGSAALAAGGCTTYLDMPLNGMPPTVHLPAMLEKLKAAQNRSSVDYALWGGLVPGNLDRLEELAEAGVIGFKAFMSSPGTLEEGAFREVDDDALLDGMRAIARLGKVLALHAEDEEMLQKIGSAYSPSGNAVIDHGGLRPIEAEVSAVRKALAMGKQTGCALHFVHISSQEAVSLIQEAKINGEDVTVETCPHYLALTEEDLAEHGAWAKCAPPLRSHAEMEKLWTEVLEGRIDWIASDHSPCLPEMKDGDVLSAWGGISGAQSSLELLYEEGHVKRGLSLPDLAALIAGNPAKRFGLDRRKGEIAVGKDADFAMIDPRGSYTLQAGDLYYKHPFSPYVGRYFSGRVSMTLCRGKVVYDRRSGIGESAVGMWLTGRS